eukprot:Clim_evm4s55 gene=Clim_evmTU4s55
MDESLGTPDESEVENWAFFGQTSELVEGKPVKKVLLGEMVIVVMYKGEYHCLDSVCYHAGGPLEEADIQDIEDADGKHHACLVCPWHHYIISMERGEGMYLDMDQKTRSKGYRQRKHICKVMDDGRIIIGINPAKPYKM